MISGLVVGLVFVPLMLNQSYGGVSMVKPVSDYTSPPHKIIKFLREGRDQLREKYAQARVVIRRAENQVRAVTKSREAWKKRALKAEAELKNTASPNQVR